MIWHFCLAHLQVRPFASSAYVDEGPICRCMSACCCLYAVLCPKEHPLHFWY